MQNSWPFKRVVVIVGGFGSGKSEYAINLALEKAQPESSQQVTLVDLDLVNAYFRSREMAGLLESRGIKAVIPREDIRFSDLPIAGPGVGALIKSPDYNIILDVGGDDMGATALGTYREEISNAEHHILMIVNPFRPFTRDVDGIMAMKTAIEYTSGLVIHGLISNPNIGAGTSLDQVLDKHQVVVEAAARLQLPVVELALLEELYQLYQHELEQTGISLRPLKIYLSPEWLLKQQKEDMVNSGYSNIS